MEKQQKKTDWLYVSMMMVLASALCFFQLTRNSFTFDEVTSLIISKSWHTMWQILWTKEGNMWFYFVLVNFWSKLGMNEYIIRSLSALIGVLTVPIFYTFAQKIHSEKVAKIATVFFVMSLYLVYYAQMARSYALSLLLVTLSSYLFLKLIQKSAKPLSVFFYIIVTSLAVYTHLLVVLAIATQYIYLLVFPKNIPWKKIFLSWAGIFICIIPLILAPSVRNGHQLDWLQVHPFVFLPFGIVTLAGDSVFFTVVAGCIILFLLWKKRHVIMEKSMERFSLLWLLLWAGFPILFSYLFSVFIKPIYQPQYFNACLPAFILLVVIGLEELRHKKVLYKTLLVLLFAFSLLRLVQWYSGSTHYLTEFLVLENRYPDNWRDAASYVAQRGQSTDAVIFYAYYVHEPFEYYYTQYKDTHLPKIEEISSGPYALGGGTKIPEPNFTLLDSLSQKYYRVWLVLENNDTPELGKRTQWLEVEKELSKNYTLVSSDKFNHITIKLWERKMNSFVGTAN